MLGDGLLLVGLHAGRVDAPLGDAELEEHLVLAVLPARIREVVGLLMDRLAPLGRGHPQPGLLLQLPSRALSGRLGAAQATAGGEPIPLAWTGRVTAVQQKRAAGLVDEEHPPGAAVDDGHVVKPIAREVDLTTEGPSLLPGLIRDLVEAVRNGQPCSTTDRPEHRG